MKKINNLNQLDKERVIVDEEGKMFIINSIYIDNAKQECQLTLVELNKHFTIWSMTLPIASNKDYEFISKNDKDWKFKFNETNITKSELSNLISNELSKLI